MRIRRRLAIEAPAEAVWDAITDLGRAGEWAPGFDEYPFISSDWPKQGSQATWRCRFGPFRLDFNLTLTESLRGESLQIANRSLLGEGLEVYSFTTSGKTTTVWYDASDEPNLLGRVVTPLFEAKLVRMIDQTMAGLKAYCERHAKGASSIARS
jgi:hypothetical protein